MREIGRKFFLDRNKILTAVLDGQRCDFLFGNLAGYTPENLGPDVCTSRRMDLLFGIRIRSLCIGPSLERIIKLLQARELHFSTKQYRFYPLSPGIVVGTEFIETLSRHLEGHRSIR